MSSRQLRKLRQQEELEKAKHAQDNEAAEEVEEESEDEPLAPANSKPSLFANLAELGDGNEDDDDQSAEEAEVVEEVKKEPAPSASKKKSKKAKKKAKKGKEKAPEVDKNADDDDIEVALRELEVKDSIKAAVNPTKLPTDPEYERVCVLLGIVTQHLKVANEMKSLYGNDFSAAESAGDTGAQAGRRRRHQNGQPAQVDIQTALKGRHLPGKGLSDLTIRRNVLIEAKKDWPNSSTGGLTMVVVDDKADDDTVEFRFVHDANYQVNQQAFHRLVDEGEPMNLVSHLINNPYHISTLLQVSRYSKDTGDHSLSSELLERALFSFGRAAPSLFNTKLAQGKARLDFVRPENRELWLAGYHYIKSLIQKGTYRTALEWAKLLMSLDPEGDPYAMRLVLHEFALKAGENKWLLDLNDSNLLSMWSEEDVKVTVNGALHTTPSFALAAMNLKEPKKCRTLLTEAMQSHPWLFVKLFAELSLDAPPSIWGIQTRGSSEELFTELYVSQTKDLWNTPEATALLQEIAHTIPKVDVKSIPELQDGSITPDVVRFIYLENNRNLMSLISDKLSRRSEDSDPYAPDMNIFSYPSQQFHLESSQGLPNAGPNEFANAYDPLPALLRMWQRDGGDANVQAREADVDRVMPEGVTGYLARALALFRGGPNAQPPEAEDYARDEESDQGGDDTDATSLTEDEEDGMPGLIPMPGGFPATAEPSDGQEGVVVWTSTLERQTGAPTEDEHD